MAQLSLGQPGDLFLVTLSLFLTSSVPVKIIGAMLFNTDYKAQGPKISPSFVLLNICDKGNKTIHFSFTAQLTFHIAFKAKSV